MGCTFLAILCFGMASGAYLFDSIYLSEWLSDYPSNDSIETALKTYDKEKLEKFVKYAIQSNKNTGLITLGLTRNAFEFIYTITAMFAVYFIWLAVTFWRIKRELHSK